MQYSHIHKLFAEVAFGQKGIIVKGLVLVVSLGFIIYNFKVSPIGNLDFFTNIFSPNKSVSLLYGVLILMPLNWSIESFKWYYLINKTQPLTFYKAFKGILCGLTLGFFTPLGSGDYFGRLLQLEHNDRNRHFGSVFLTNMSQFYVTFCTGCLAVFYILSLQHAARVFLVALMALLLFAMSIVSLSLLAHYKLLQYLTKSWVIKPFAKYFKILKSIHSREIVTIVALSFLRYGVFATQFLLLLFYFQISASIPHMLAGIAFVFFAKSLLPTFFDVGVREAAALYYFSDAGAPDNILKACVCLWAINVVVPVLLGLVTIPGMQLRLK